MDFCDLMEHTSEKSEYVDVDSKGNRIAEDKDDNLDEDLNLYQQISNTSAILSSNSKNKIDFEDIETVQSEQDFPGLFNFDTDRAEKKDKVVEDLRKSMSINSQRENDDP